MDSGLTGSGGKRFEGLVEPDFRDSFELRKVNDQLAAIAVKSSSAEAFHQNIYSEQKYSFKLSLGTKVTAISDAQWFGSPLIKPPLQSED